MTDDSYEQTLARAQRAFAEADFPHLVELLGDWASWPDPVGIDAGILLLRTCATAARLIEDEFELARAVRVRSERHGDRSRIARAAVYGFGLQWVRNDAPDPEPLRVLLGNVPPADLDTQADVSALLLRLAQARGDRSESAGVAARLESLMGEIDDPVRLCFLALQLSGQARASGDPGRGARLEAHLRRGLSQLEGDYWRARFAVYQLHHEPPTPATLRRVEGMVEVMRRSGDADMTAMVSILLGNLQRRADDSISAARSYEAAASFGSAPRQRLALVNLAVLAIERDDWSEAKQRLDAVPSGVTYQSEVALLELVTTPPDTPAAEWWRALRLLRRVWVDRLDPQPDHADTLRMGAGRQGTSARAAWLHGLALWVRQRLGDDLGVDSERAALRALADRGVPVPLGDELELGAVLGRGGMGEVRSARDPRGRVVAVKVLTHASSAARKSLERELRLLGRLRHPGIVPLLDQGRVDATTAAMTGLPAGSPWLVMPLVGGGSLSRWCGLLSWSSARTVLVRILEALAYAHGEGVLHLDLKPENVLLADLEDPTSGLRLADFGLARHESDGAALLGGTPQYMAPEQFRGRWREFGPATDLYGLGCLAIDLLAGAPPFMGDSVAALRNAHLMQTPPPLEAASPVPPGLQGWLDVLLAKDPVDRYASAAEAHEALSTLGDAADEATPGVWPPIARNTFALSEIETVIDVGTTPEAGVPAVRLPLAPAVGSRRRAPEDWRSTAPPDESPEPQGVGLIDVRVPAMVARTAERDGLWQALRGVDDEGPALIQLHGAAGVGTSRLCDWLVATAQRAGAAHGVRVGCGLADDPLRVALSHDLRVTGLQGSELKSQLRRSLRLEGVARLEPLVDTLAAIVAGEPRTVRQRHGALLAWLQLRCTWRSVVLVLDDAIRSGDAVAFAERVCASALPVLVLTTAPTGRLPEHSSEAARLDALGPAWRLGPLSAPALAAALRSIAPLSEPTLDRLVQRASGNVRFAVDLVRDWLQQHLLDEQEDGRWALRPGALAPVPSSHVALWSARLARLDAPGGSDALRALQLGAVLGPVLRTDEWIAACAAAGVVPPSALLDHMEARGWVERQADGVTLTASGLPESLLQLASDAGDGSELRRSAATALESLGGPEQLARAAEHRAAGGAAAEVLEPLLVGARLALDSGRADVAARRLAAFTRIARARSLHADDPRWLRAARVEVDIDMGRLELHHVGEPARRLLELATRHGNASDEIRALQALSRFQRMRGRADAADQSLEAALASARDAGVLATAAGIDLQQELAFRQLETGRVDAGLATLDAVGSITPADDKARRSQLAALGHLHLRRGELTEARTAFEAALALGDPHILAASWILTGLGDAARRSGDVAAASEAYQAAMELEHALGRFEWHVSALNLSMVAVQRGELAGLAESLPVLAEAFERQRFALLCAATHVLMLALPAEPTPWLEALGEVEQELATLTTRDPELVRAIEIVAIHLGAADRARALWSLAAAQWELLGEADAASDARLRARAG